MSGAHKEDLLNVKSILMIAPTHIRTEEQTRAHKHTYVLMYVRTNVQMDG